MRRSTDRTVCAPRRTRYPAIPPALAIRVFGRVMDALVNVAIAAYVARNRPLALCPRPIEESVKPVRQNPRRRLRRNALRPRSEGPLKKLAKKRLHLAPISSVLR